MNDANKTLIYVLLNDYNCPVKAYETKNAALVALFKKYVEAYIADENDPTADWTDSWSAIIDDLGDLINLDQIDNIGRIQEVELEVENDE